MKLNTWSVSISRVDDHMFFHIAQNAGNLSNKKNFFNKNIFCISECILIEYNAENVYLWVFYDSIIVFTESLDVFMLSPPQF